MLGNKHVLVVDDDPSLSEWIADYLTEQSFMVSIANRGDTAIELIEEDQPDIVLLDLMLPVKSGFEVCKKVRDFYSKPILMLTACDEETDEVLGLEFGADDYLTKPIRPRVLLARIHALLRRNSETDQSLVKTIGNLRIDARSKTVTIDGQASTITANEFDLLWLLTQSPGKAVSREEIFNQLRGFDYDGFDRSVDIRISRLRKKLGDNTNQSFRIKTVRGKGYLFASNTS